MRLMWQQIVFTIFSLKKYRLFVKYDNYERSVNLQYTLYVLGLFTQN